MEWFKYLNFVIHQYYERKGDSTPYLFSFLASSLLVYMNVVSLFTLIGYFIPSITSVNKLVYLCFSLLLLLLNYILLYRKNYYKEVFYDFQKHSERYTAWNRSVRNYIIGSIILLLIVLVMADYRHGGLY